MVVSSLQPAVLVDVSVTLKLPSVVNVWVGYFPTPAAGGSLKFHVEEA
jgi:hypothetical protein